jgi:thymidylate kinase
VAYASREIERLIATVPVVGDRYLPTTLAYHRVMGYRPDLSGLQLDLVLPDAVVVLTCDEDIRTGRINARGWSPNDVLEETFRLSKAFEQELVSAALELVGSAYVIDTSALSAEEVAGEVARSLGLVQCPTANPSGGGARLAHLAEAASAKLYSGPGGVARRPGPLIPSAITVGRKEYR